MKRGFLAASLALFLSSCSSEDPCDEQAGSVLCGYCDQDAATSGNPHAGKCRYCAEGTTCSGDICSDALTCLPPDDGGGGGSTCGTGNTCINNLCSPGLWCCLAGHSCNMAACGCN